MARGQPIPIGGSTALILFIMAVGCAPLPSAVPAEPPPALPAEFPAALAPTPGSVYHLSATPDFQDEDRAFVRTDTLHAKIDPVLLDPDRIAAADMAVKDGFGRRLVVPLHQKLGRVYWAKIPLADLPSTEEEWAVELRLRDASGGTESSRSLIHVQAASNERCNGRDDTGEGAVDEGLMRPCRPGSDRGECVRGLATCAEGRWSACTPATGPAPEICGNGLDEDCDGADQSCACTRCEACGRDGPCTTEACMGCGDCYYGTQPGKPFGCYACSKDLSCALFITQEECLRDACALGCRWAGDRCEACGEGGCPTPARAVEDYLRGDVSLDDIYAEGAP